jgi:hypothetical protein
MGRQIPRVTEVSVPKDRVLRVSFDDGLTGDVDLSDAVGRGPMFEPLHDPEFFAQVKVDAGTHTVSWPWGLDLDPEALHEQAARKPVKRPK